MIGTVVTSRPRRVLATVAALFVLAAVFGAPVPGLLRGGNDFEDPASEATVVRDRLEQVTGMGATPGLIAAIDPGRAGLVAELAKDLRDFCNVVMTTRAYSLASAGTITRSSRARHRREAGAAR